MHVPFFGSMVNLQDFLFGAWCGLSHPGIKTIPPVTAAEVEAEEEEEAELDEESLQIL